RVTRYEYGAVGDTAAVDVALPVVRFITGRRLARVVQRLLACDRTWNFLTDAYTGQVKAGLGGIRQFPADVRACTQRIAGAMIAKPILALPGAGDEAIDVLIGKAAAQLQAPPAEAAGIQPPLKGAGVVSCRCHEIDGSPQRA